ncbi:hypothetical protein LIER_35522 [Lithospermum erythrorhizon]|uniref:Uncharacterized protein n=1 Tax=Lithospermum erythrorhizon TaxID=34254 RepID=A0AAV3NTF5_LITER
MVGFASRLSFKTDPANSSEFSDMAVRQCRLSRAGVGKEGATLQPGMITRAKSGARRQPPRELFPQDL